LIELEKLESKISTKSVIFKSINQTNSLTLSSNLIEIPLQYPLSDANLLLKLGRSKYDGIQDDQIPNVEPIYLKREVS